jgi:hypothetical protein
MESHKNEVTIKMSTDLAELVSLLSKERNIKKGEGINDRASSSAIAMLGHLSREHNSWSPVPRKINTVEELYSLSAYEIQYKFRYYGKKTWQRLNKHLKNKGLPSLKLPPKYTDSQ